MGEHLSKEQEAQIDTFFKDNYNVSYEKSRSVVDFKKIDEQKQKNTNIQTISKNIHIKKEFDDYYNGRLKQYSDKFDEDNTLREKKKKRKKKENYIDS